MAGIMDVYAVSLRPDMALRLALGEYKIHLTPFDLEYKGKVIIHSCSYNSEEDRKEGLDNIKKLGFNSLDIPTGAILGWAKIDNVKSYIPSTFKLEENLHEYGNNLDLFKAQQQWKDVFGYLINENHYLYLPIEGVGRDKKHGDWWTPESPFDALCFKRAFDGQSIDVEKVEV